MPALRAYREVVPNDSVLFEEVLEALRESQLAAAVEAREAQARDQDCHLTTERLTANSELKCNAPRCGASGRTRPARHNVSQFAHRRPGDVAGWSTLAGAKARRLRLSAWVGDSVASWTRSAHARP